MCVLCAILLCAAIECGPRFDELCRCSIYKDQQEHWTLVKHMMLLLVLTQSNGTLCGAARQGFAWSYYVQ
jgi:hypothetical protein